MDPNQFARLEFLLESILKRLEILAPNDKRLVEEGHAWKQYLEEQHDRRNS